MDVDAGDYLIDMLMEAGPAKSSQLGGVEPLDWRDLESYVNLTKKDLEDWESITLIRMSQAYCRGLSEGSDPFSIPPDERKGSDE